MEPARHGPQAYHVEERLHAGGGGPKRSVSSARISAISSVPTQVRQALIDTQALVHLGNVGIGEERFDAHR